MRHLTKLTVPELGDITLNRNITFGILIEAEERIKNVVENEKATVFVNFVLANMFVEPEISLEEIENLSDETTQTLILSVAEMSGIQKEFEDFPDSLSPQEKLYRAYYQHLSDTFAFHIKRMLKDVSELSEISDTFAFHITRMLKDIPELSEIKKQVKERLDALETDAKSVTLLLAQVNLWIPPFEARYVQSNLISRLKDIINREHATPKMVEESFIEYFEENNWEMLKQMISSWEDNPHFANRMSIIFDALDAHINKKYTLSVPAILPQIEGVASSILETPANQKTGNIIRDILQKKLPKYLLRTVPIDSLISFITDIVYTGTNFDNFTTYLHKNGITESDFLNRHSILHGVHTNYAHKGISFRAFLLLDALSAIK